MEQNKKNNKKLIIIAAAVLVVLVAVFAVVWGLNKPATTKGAKNVSIAVVDDNAVETTYSVNTDAEYLAQIFDEVDSLTVEGSTSEYGLYIETVNGLTADYAANGAYWAIYVNGEYGMYGADSQPVNDGDAFSLVYEVYVAAE